jgi:hypothetical protein
VSVERESTLVLLFFGTLPHRPSLSSTLKILSPNHDSATRWRINMLETVAVILIVLWALGLVSSYSMGGFIHILLVVAIVLILVRIINGKRL